MLRLSALSIRGKLIAIVMSTTGAALLLAGLGVATFEVRSYRINLSREIGTVARIVSINSTASLSFEDSRDATDVLSALASQPEIQAACLYRGRGPLFASYRAPGSRIACPERPGRDGEAWNEHFRYQIPILLGEERIGTLWISAHLRTLRERMEVFAAFLAVVLVVAALAGLLMSARMQRIVSGPILSLANTARRITERRDLSLRAPEPGRDEVGVALGAFNDMLDRIEKADAALRAASEDNRRQAEILQSVLDNIGEGLVVYDQKRGVQIWNPAATRILGQGPVGVDLHHWAETFDLFEEDGSAHFAFDRLPLVAALRGEAVTDREIRVGRKTPRWISSSSRPLRDEAGQVRGAVAVFRDVSARKAAEEALRALNTTLEERVRERTAAAEERAAELKRSNEELERFAYIASHDLQEPLRAAASYTQLIQQRLDQHPDDQARLYLSHLLAGVGRMRALVQDLLDYSRLGRQQLNLERVHVAEVLQAALADLTAAVEESRATLRIGPLPEVTADTVQLTQLLRNLVGNAIKFRADHPLEVEINATKENSHWRFDIKDNGIGIEGRFLQRIFVIFQRLHGRAQPGTGIGLAICKKIVERHGGSIWVESEVGVGSTFHFTLPNGDEEQHA